MPTDPANLIEMPVKDPVCGMTVDPATSKYKFEHAGKNYYFCCAPCLEKFKADPDRFLEQPSPAHSPGLVRLGTPPKKIDTALTAPAAGNYVCPMCPEVRETEPGACP